MPSLVMVLIINLSLIVWMLTFILKLVKINMGLSDHYFMLINWITSFDLIYKIKNEIGRVSFLRNTHKVIMLEAGANGQNWRIRSYYFFFPFPILSWCISFSSSSIKQLYQTNVSISSAMPCTQCEIIITFVSTNHVLSNQFSSFGFAIQRLLSCREAKFSLN